MNSGRREGPGRGPDAPVSSGLVMFRGGTLIPIRLPFPEDAAAPKESAELQTSAPNDRRVQPPQEDARAALGHNLRWAFPLPDSGSFDQLLEAIDEA